MNIRYRLIVTTCGRPGVLDQTLASFEQKVSPKPREMVVIDDSGDADYRQYLDALLAEMPWRTDLLCHRQQRGFCEAVATGWKAAAAPGPHWVFWCEDDFEFIRGVDLNDLATVLNHEPHVAQMALLRDPVNEEEKRVGGYMNLRPETYARRGHTSRVWWEHGNHWTTNPSLFPRAIAADFPWIGWERNCEGHFGIRLRRDRPGTTFGIYGAGDPWVLHHGVRSGIGY